MALTVTNAAVNLNSTLIFKTYAAHGVNQSMTSEETCAI